MGFISDHAEEMFRPGKATLFFRNLTAVMACVYFLQRAGIISLQSDFWNVINDIIPVKWSVWGKAQVMILMVLLGIQWLLKKVEDLVRKRFTMDLKDPNCPYYNITALIWVARGADEAVSYLLWFLCMLSVLSYGHSVTTDILTGTIAFFTFFDIATGNFQMYKKMIEKAHLPRK